MILVVCKPYNDMIMAKLDKKQQKIDRQKFNMLLYFCKGTKMSY
jgi:hypothetical protein